MLNQDEPVQRDASTTVTDVPDQLTRHGTDNRYAAGWPGSAFAADARPAQGFADRVLVTLAGIRQPIVAILLLMAFFTVISGKPVDGFLLLLVATALSWDAGTKARELKAGREAELTAARESELARSEAELSVSVVPAAGASAVRRTDAGSELAAQEPAWRPTSGLPGRRVIAVGVTGSMIYALIVGSFTRYSWPATFGVAGLGASVVLLGWGGPVRKREIPGKFPRIGVMTWGTILIAGGLWELSALLEQPNIDTSSWAHPTISTLTDPLLGSGLGRGLALLAWIGFGFWLVER